MTWHHDNYGTVLQAVALQHAIQELGFSVDIVDYPVSGLRKENFLKKLKSIKRVSAKLVRQYNKRRYGKGTDQTRAEAFGLFKRQYLHFTTKKVVTPADFDALNDNYGIFVCGSDQIWSPTLFNARYYLDFVHSHKKRVAYAPSFGVEEIADQDITETIRRHIKRFDHISVREERGARLIEGIIGQKPPVLVDPTLLLHAEEWRKYAAPEEKRSPYILCYFIGEKEAHWKHVQKLAQKAKLETCIIPMHQKDYYRNGHIIKGKGPAEFLSLVKNASLVCTDSYHGMIFAIVFSIPFFVYKRFSDKDKRSQNSRVYSLLNRLQLRERMITDYRRVSKEMFSYDYEITHDILRKEREKSIDYLRAALSKTDTGNIKYEQLKANSVPTGKIYGEKQNCCGCAACFNACPVQAIQMEPDVYGFRYPTINEDVCIGCGLCKKVCAFQNGVIMGSEPIATFAVVNKDVQIIKNSSSGGAFGALASLVIGKGGVVFGCAFNTVLEPEHILIDNLEDLYRLQGSKYVQSNINDTLAKAKKYLEEGMYVLFTGTPCQVAGLSSYLGRDYENLITADLVCHGVPSDALFKDYICFMEKKLGGKITRFMFRDKVKGWGEQGRIIYTKNGRTKEKLVRPYFSSYYGYFLRGNICRESCYACKYACGIRQGDFTLGDYWGVKKVHPQIDKKNGVSLLLANSKKGMGLIEEMKQYLDMTMSSFNQAQAYNKQLNAPVTKCDERDYILKLWFEQGYKAVAKIYFKRNKALMIKSLLPPSLKEYIKKLLGNKTNS